MCMLTCWLHSGLSGTAADARVEGQAESAKHLHNTSCLVQARIAAQTVMETPLYMSLASMLDAVTACSAHLLFSLKPICAGLCNTSDCLHPCYLAGACYFATSIPAPCQGVALQFERVVCRTPAPATS